MVHINRNELTHRVDVVCHISQNAVFPVEQAGPFPLVLLGLGVYTQRDSLLNGLNRLAAVDVRDQLNPLIVGDLAAVRQIAGQRHRGL